ncbi:Glyoxylase, beta-lactamase superfamily II [Paenibacillus tianmuensis]|uniref:Glyoxylase, beta-lactamase superfamily II n=2 Tax=Paenibacillus tianmuensis TaxID=624147 RepID=A0A1G4QZ79_9BACL|nr:Glyoxylase, beta-lactamase superfamily II [Paenibacillus tianmuensis]
MNFVNYIYFVVDKKTRDIAIIDPSWNLSEVESCLQRLNGQLKAIWLTHSHFDHINLVNPLLERYNPQVFMSKEEIDYYNFRCRNLHPIQGDDSIQLGETEIITLSTPGHTAGSCCYLLSDHLFSGDTLFIEGCGFCDPNGGDPEKLYDSLQKIKRELEAYVKIYPAHAFEQAPGLSFGHVLKQNIYYQIADKELFVTFRMRPNQTGLFDFK